MTRQEDIAMLERRISKLTGLLSDLDKRISGDVSIAEFLHEPRNKAAVKLSALKDQLKSLKAEDPDIKGILQEIEDAQAYVDGLEIHATDDPGFAVNGYAVRWDSIAQGASGPTRFTSTAFDNEPFSCPLVYQHDLAQPIGYVALTPDAVGLRADGRIVATRLGQDTRLLLKSGSISGLSIGFTVNKSSKDKSGVRIVTSATVSELSVVTSPADPGARVAKVDGQVVPLFHAAAPRELETTSMLSRNAVSRVLAEVEREYAATMGYRKVDREPVPEQPDFLSCRVLSTVERSQREESARPERFQRAIQREPRLAKMETAQLMTYVEAMHEADVVLSSGARIEFTDQLEVE